MSNQAAGGHMGIQRYAWYMNHGIDEASGKGEYVLYADHIAKTAALREALEEAENKLRAHDGLKRVKHPTKINPPERAS